MSAFLPDNVKETDITRQLLGAGLERTHQGKVRDTFDLGSGRLLMLATNRISIFDFVLPDWVSRKGEILTALTIFWLGLLGGEVRNHLLAYGASIDKYLPKELRRMASLQARALVVEKLEMIPVECIVRGYLTGSGWKSYQETQMVCGVPLPADLENGAKLDEPIFTPTTKAESGHDEQLDTQAVEGEYGPELVELSVQIFKVATAFADSRGIVVVDTKIEFGRDDSGTLTLADEVLTPDSSRFWDSKQYDACAPGKLPGAMDKQLVRDWGMDVKVPKDLTDEPGGIAALEPSDTSHRAFVDGLKVPSDVIASTMECYLNLFSRLTGQTLDSFQGQKMEIG